MTNYPDDVRLVFRHLPLISIHDKASLAHQAAEAAGAQGMFWEMSDVLFERRDEWAGLSEGEFRQTLVGYAQEIGLPDGGRFEADLANGTYAAEMGAHFNDAIAAGVNSTPTVFLNGIPLQGNVIDPVYLQNAVETILLASRYPEAPPMAIDQGTTYYATLVTEHGDVVVELFAGLAPQTVNNFVYLACVGYYDGNTFYRVLPDFAAQTGDPTNIGWGGPGYNIPDEVENGLQFDRPGLVSMALSASPDSAGGQFFITYSPQEHLNGTFTVFGEVVSGMDVLEALQTRDPQANPDAPPGDLLETIIIEEEG